MKTLLFIISTTAVFIVSQNNKLYHEAPIKKTFSPAQLDSVLEAGRVERMRTKFI